MRPSELLVETPPLVTAGGTVFRFDGGAPFKATRLLPCEVPINVVYAPVPFAVMMATPADLEDFAYGFSLTEGIIDQASDVRDVVAGPVDGGLRLTITLVPGKLRDQLARGRNLVGRTGCGVCGIDDIAALPRARRPSGIPRRVKLSSVRRALAALETRQPLNVATRAVHAAAWFDGEGHAVAVREDVGRHNALDKLIGALLRAEVDAGDGFVVITSRCSFEMVEKVAAFGARTLVAISAPTTLAVERARSNDVAILAVARADSALCLTGADRFIDDLTITQKAS